jgi:hypothetical protein
MIVTVPVLAFWIPDGFFLSQERLFRGLYDRGRVLDVSDIDYSMDTRDFRNIARNGWACYTLSRTLLVFFGACSVRRWPLLFWWRWSYDRHLEREETRRD